VIIIKTKLKTYVYKANFLLVDCLTNKTLDIIYFDHVYLKQVKVDCH